MISYTPDTGQVDFDLLLRTTEGAGSSKIVHWIKDKGSRKKFLSGPNARQLIVSGRIPLTARSVGLGALLDLTALQNLYGGSDPAIDLTGYKVMFAHFEPEIRTGGNYLNFETMRVGTGPPPFTVAGWQSSKLFHSDESAEATLRIERTSHILLNFGNGHQVIGPTAKHIWCSGTYAYSQLAFLFACWNLTGY